MICAAQAWLLIQKPWDGWELEISKEASLLAMSQIKAEMLWYKTGEYTQGMANQYPPSLVALKVSPGLARTPWSIV